MDDGRGVVDDGGALTGARIGESVMGLVRDDQGSTLPIRPGNARWLRPCGVLRKSFLASGSARDGGG
jgi:hypothetical protein